MGLYSPDRKATMLDSTAERGMESSVVLTGKVMTAAVSAANPAMEPDINRLRTHVNFSSVTVSSIVVTRYPIIRSARIPGIIAKIHMKTTGIFIFMDGLELVS